jgi:haloalkane dehalogenase
MHRHIIASLLTALALSAAPAALAQSVQGPDSAACKAPMKMKKAKDGTEFVRTPEACFAGLPDFDFKARFVNIDGLRQGYYDEGPRDGPVVLMVTGQPTWSYINRDLLRDLSKMGYRAIAMDNLGFGTSDKPVNLDRFTFKDHAHRLVAFMDALKLKKVTLFANDWGSTVGLYVAGGDLNRFDRIIMGNGGLPVPKAKIPVPTDIATNNAMVGGSFKMISPQQPKFFDANGNSIFQRQRRLRAQVNMTLLARG